MALGLGISGIGYPAMGLGTYGLSAGGSYGSYDNYMPSMMGMNLMSGMGSGYGMNSMMGMGGMMGMYNPLYYTQMQGAAEQIQAQHACDMHTILMNNEVRANHETDSALISKMLENSDVLQGIENLHVAVKEGKQDDICRKFDELKTYIYNTYRDELTARGAKNNPAISATNLINKLYGNIITAQNGGEPVTLRGDIERYGESSAMNGFMNGFRAGHGVRYIDQTLSHCFGDEIEDKKSKDRRKFVASFVGRGASVVEKGVYGAAGGAALYGIARGLKAGLKASFSKTASTAASGAASAGTTAVKSGFFKQLGKWAWIGAAAGAVADIWWQCSSSRDAA